MKRRYYYQPPTTPDKLPPFMRSKYYDVSSSIKRLIQWSKMEYNKMVVEATRHRLSIRAVRYLHEEYSAMRVLAEMEGFRDLLALVNEENYNQLDGRDRVFLRRAYEMYVSLS